MSDKLGPYELNSIVTGDCLEVMSLLPDKSVDMLLSDWPYAETQNEWDSLIPLEPLWEQVKRVIKPGGAIVMTATQPFASMVIMANLKWFKWEDVWDKVMPVGFLNAKVMPLRRHESILVFGQGRITYNPQMTTGKLRKKGGYNNLSNCYGDYKSVSKLSDDYYPTSIIEASNANQSAKQHETEKPVALFSYLIRTYSNPGDLILDNAAGSCTTAIAAIDTGRNWLCIERDSGYAEIGRNRVAKRLSQPFLPGMVEAAKPESIQLEFGG